MMEDENSSKVLPHLYAREGDLVQATNPVLQGATPDFRIWHPTHSDSPTEWIQLYAKRHYFHISHL